MYSRQLKHDLEQGLLLEESKPKENKVIAKRFAYKDIVDLLDQLHHDHIEDIRKKLKIIKREQARRTGTLIEFYGLRKNRLRKMAVILIVGTIVLAITAGLKKDLNNLGIGAGILFMLASCFCCLSENMEDVASMRRRRSLLTCGEFFNENNLDLSQWANKQEQRKVVAFDNETSVTYYIWELNEVVRRYDRESIYLKKDDYSKTYSQAFQWMRSKNGLRRMGESGYSLFQQPGLRKLTQEYLLDEEDQEAVMRAFGSERNPRL